MVKLLSAVSVLAVLVAFICGRAYISAKKEIGRLEGEKTALTQTIKDLKNAEVEANKTIKELRKIRDENKTTLDWYNTRVPTDLLRGLQKRHNRRKN